MSRSVLARSILMITWACVLVAWPAPARAQGEATLSGSVRDGTGTLLAGAAVTVTNERTGEARQVVTTDGGVYRVAGLKPSTYTVRAENPPLAPTEYTGITLGAGLSLSLDLELQPPGVTETVTVEGRAPALDLSSARVGVNVNQREVQDLPINGRQMSQLYLQAPGSLNSGTGTFSDIRFSGRAVEQNVLRYDGVEGTGIIDAAPGNLNGEIPTPFKLQASLENVQEFRVESNSYPAEYGTGTGGQVSVVTKSGSNALHGTVFEYLRNDALDAPNYFDTAAGLPKSALRQNQFGGSAGGPLLRNKAFFFGSYEGYSLEAGVNFVEAVPSAAAWSRAVPEIAPLRNAFLAPGAVVLPGASTDPDFDVAQLQSTQDVSEHSLSARVDVKLTPNWSTYVRVFHDQGTSDQPEGVTGRTIHITDNPTNAVVSLQGLVGTSALNDLKIGYNAAPTRINGVAPTVNGIPLSSLAINLSGSVANTGIAGQGASSGIAVPGGLVRANSATNGRGQPYDPYSLSFIDTFSVTRGSHYFKVGGEYRRVRMTTDRLGGTTYTFANLTSFLANEPQTIQYLGDLSEPSVFNGGATGPRHTRQDYVIGYAQDEWHASPTVTLNYGVRYDYYTPLSEANDLAVAFDIDRGVIKPAGEPLYHSKANNVQPRVSATWALGDHTVARGGFGVFVGPGQTEDQIQPVESDRISSALSGGAFPIDPAVLRERFVDNPDSRAFQPRAYANDYTIPERVYQYTASIQHELPARMTATAAYVGSQGRNLFLRSVANQIVDVRTNPDPTKPAIVIRQFSIVNADGSVSNPFAEVDYKTSGGRDNYNALQLSLSRPAASGLTLNAQYTLARSFGNTGGSNEALTAANNAMALADFDYDLGYNAFDVRHTFNLSALYSVPYGRGRRFGGQNAFLDAVLGHWDVGGILNARSGLPIDVRITRPDVVYQDAEGHVFTNPAEGRAAIINTPGGGASRNVRRPDLVPGVDPFVHDGGLVYLNPAAFATPAPGTFGNLQRGVLKGPGFAQLDLVLAKRFELSETRRLELRWEIFNVLNKDNFANPVATLPAALPANRLDESNRVQPGDAYTAAAAGTFGRIRSTVGRTVGLGTNRQMQFALRFVF